MLLLTKNFLVLARDYYIMRETHYTANEAIERYSLGLSFTPEVEIEQGGKAMVLAPVLAASTKAFMPEKISLYKYTFYGTRPYYVGLKGDNQYLVDQMGFVKPVITLDWRFQKLQPGLVVVSGANLSRVKGLGDFLNLQQRVYLRGRVKYEQY